MTSRKAKGRHDRGNNILGTKVREDSESDPGDAYRSTPLVKIMNRSGDLIYLYLKRISNVISTCDFIMLAFPNLTGGRLES